MSTDTRQQLTAIIEDTLENPLSQLFSARRHAVDAVAALAARPDLLRALADEQQPDASSALDLSSLDRNGLLAANAIATALIEHIGHVPLSLRYAAAHQAVKTAADWVAAHPAPAVGDRDTCAVCLRAIRPSPVTAGHWWHELAPPPRARDWDHDATPRQLTEQEGGPPNERHPDPTAPELAVTRTSTNWCPSCEQEAGTARIHSHGKDFCGTCGARLVVRPDSGKAAR